MVFILKKVSEILSDDFKKNGITGLKSSYIQVINYALDNGCSIDELKSIKSLYDEIKKSLLIR